MKKNSYAADEVLVCTKGELFGQDKPKLPAPPMLMLDRVTEINNNGGQYNRGELKAELDLHDDLWFLSATLLGILLCQDALG